MRIKEVVQFEDGSYSELPINWIIDDCDSALTYCWWPPSNIKNLSSLMTRKATVNPKTWQKHCVSIINVCSTLAKARQIAENSDYCTTDDNKGKGRRTKFLNSKYIDEDECSNISSMEGVDDPIEENDLPLPAYPQAKIMSESESQASLKGIDEHLSPIQYSPLVEEGIEEENVAISDNTTNNNNLLVTADQFSIIIRILTKIEIKIKNLNQRLDKLTITNNRLVGSTENVKKYFPLQTIENVIIFEEQLKNATFAKEFFSYIDRFGGKSPADNVRQILSNLFSKEFAALYTWKGRKNKINISQLQMVQIIKDKIIDSTSNFREVDFNTEAAEWFRLGLQRKCREEKKK
ncbi:uncharacterized protein LOC143369666 isoform X2 [Andrena cerasifolii]|uniref:uncharacterized protein LOC143369666 isoform X2 n=1 Tax=Andrena cerasifolii TaxID=2819439 RepID=UPI004037F243